MAIKKTMKKAVSRAKSKVKKAPAAAKRKPAAAAKKAARAASRRKPAASTAAVRAAAPKPIGRVTHFYSGIKVAVVKFSKAVKKGAAVRFRGATTDFKQKLESLQYDHKAISSAPKGKEVGVKVKKRVREGDELYPE